MPNVTGLLTQKIGPLPGWAWALGVGGIVFFLGPKLLKGSGSTTTATAPGGFDPQSFEAGFAQGAAYQPGPGGPGAATIGPLPPVSDATSGNPINAGTKWQFSKLYGRPHPVGTPVPVGGAAPAGRSAAVGSRSTDAHAYFHPSMKHQPRYPHFVRAGVGGAAPAHTAAVHALAHQAEIHPARLHMLNPRPHRFVRVA